MDALQEFKVESGNTPAEYGKNATQINVTTKSGTNDLHGTAWEFLRNNYFDARNYFNPRGTPQPAFRRNQFGFTLGGPVSASSQPRRSTIGRCNWPCATSSSRVDQPGTTVTGWFSAVAALA
ncbi:MAG: hypothetical protein K2X03_31625 [Bryobacteraceae bacterium]|nr:hypothetical protein [Bryobacteraceae bacterium]